MSTDRDVTRIVRSWMEEGVTALPDRVLDAVLDQVPATRQRRAWWPTRRLREMNSPWKFAIAAAAILVVAVIGINLLPRQPATGGLGPSPSPTASASASASPIAMPIGSLVAGTTYAISDPCCTGPMRVLLTVPAGWETIDTVFVGKNVLGDPDRFDITLAAWRAGNVYADACHWQGTALDPPVGPTVDDLAAALAAQGRPDASPPLDVTVGGHPGKKVELAPPDDVANCDSQDGDPMYGRWSPPDGPSFAGPWTYGDGQHDTVYIIDVDGTRQVIDTNYLPGTSAANLAELQAIVDSIRFEP